MSLTMTPTSTFNLLGAQPDGVMPTKTSHKRKGDTVFAPTSANQVVVVVQGSSDNKREMTNEERMEALKCKLKALRNQYHGEAMGTDPLLEFLKEIGDEDEDNKTIEAMIQQSKQIQADLDKDIEQAQESCQQESSVLLQLSMNLSLLEQNRNKLLMDMEEMDQRQLDLQHQIALHQREVSEEIEYIDSVDEERKREVPRLKHSISLYAATTGIKWDFLHDDILSGSVAVPDRQGLKLFTIDPRDHDPVEIANRLWSLIEGSV